MSTSTIQSVNLLPVYFQTDKNSKFLSSTIDQLIQPTQISRINAYIGSTSTPNYSSDDLYVVEPTVLRQAYQLEPALVTYDIADTIQTVTTIDDLFNELSNNGSDTVNVDRLFRSTVYSYYPHIDLDKFNNYQNYYWLPDGSFLVDIDQVDLDIDTSIVGQSAATVTVNSQTVTLLNGMLVTFSGLGIDDKYKFKEFFVEGTGTSISLVPLNDLLTPEDIATPTVDFYDSTAYDSVGFDAVSNYPKIPEYITINRASKDRNPWSRYNRWVSLDTIIVSSKLNNKEVITPISNRANRPIIEFNANIKLYNFGSEAVPAVDLIDFRITDVFSVLQTVEGLDVTLRTFAQSELLIDGVKLEYGNRVIFAADPNPEIRNKIFTVYLSTLGGSTTTNVTLIHEIAEKNQSVLIKRGVEYGGTSWYFNGDNWGYAQQHKTINEGPLFDLFDRDGISYNDRKHYLSDFKGSKIFGYSLSNTNPIDKILGLRLNYLNNNVYASILFENYYANSTINVATMGNTSYSINSNQTYLKIDGTLFNIWQTPRTYEVNFNDAFGYYDVPISLTNNPLNKDFDILVAGDLKDQKTPFGTRLVANDNPISFAMMFLGKKQHSVVDAMTKLSVDYDYFKLSLINNIILTTKPNDPALALDQIIKKINLGKNTKNSYYLSDMVPHGDNKITIDHTVTNIDNLLYSIPKEFSLKVYSTNSVLVYLNGKQMVHEIDYKFDDIEPYVLFLRPLAVADKIKINYYNDTKRSYIPSTPTKLGLYPSFLPKIYIDDSYVNPTAVIQGHDGSITVAFNDFRDEIILEYELRIYNNLKTVYQDDLFDIQAVDPNYDRDLSNTSEYSYSEITAILEKDFIKWAINYGIDYTTNDVYDETDPFTWKYAVIDNTSITGSWRAIYKYVYGTDRPHTDPWEMLGLTMKPSWWDSQYGVAPYTYGNSLLWSDLAQGKVNDPINGPKIRELYVRSSLVSYIPVDDYGNLLDPETSGIAVNLGKQSSWAVGEQGPAETAWRRSSNWAFSVQKMLAVTKPATYASRMYDPANMYQNILGQWLYKPNEAFLQLNNVPIHGKNEIANISGYSVAVSEIGQQRDLNYLENLENDLTYCSFNLFYKVGGFLNKNNIQIVIDAYEPTTNAPGASLPDDDYRLILKVSNPIKSVGISGLVIQKDGSRYIVKGYDRDNPYFTYYPAVRNSSTPPITIGGVSSEYVDWAPSQSATSTKNLKSIDLTTAQAAPSGVFYKKDQIVYYSGNFYRVKNSHQSGSTFDQTMYVKLSALPTVGGATVYQVASFEPTAYQVPYGHAFDSVQEIYDLIIGYGKWLTDQGFVFNQFNSDLQQVVDWNLTAKEFLFWTTQNWINDSIITLSPFADQLSYQFFESIVDNIYNGFYDYSLTKADGTPFNKNNLFITRQNGIFNVKTINTDDGIYFARLNSIQKEHGIVFKNKTIFGDIVYDVKTGDRQNRMKLVGFKTANWDGNVFSPGFVYDAAKTVEWAPNNTYLASSIVIYNNLYYSAIRNISRSSTFDFTKWKKLNKKPTSGLLPNFDYKITQFNDFYSLDIDNFDSGQQKSAQNLTGYAKRKYFSNIIPNPISQYKFYQGYIKEKGTFNAVRKLSKAFARNSIGDIELYEDWALRVGQYGGFTSLEEYEFPLLEGALLNNPQILTFSSEFSNVKNTTVYYIDSKKLTLSPKIGDIPVLSTTTSTNIFQLISAGYVRLDDVDATAYNQNSLLDIANNSNLLQGTTIWLGFKPNGDWDVLRYYLISADIVDVTADIVFSSLTVSTTRPHGLITGQIISITGISDLINGVYVIQSIVSSNQFTIDNSKLFTNSQDVNYPGFLFAFQSMRFLNFDSMPSDNELYSYDVGTLIWADSGNDTDNNGWAVYKKVLNYSNQIIVGTHSALSEGHGYSISARKGSDILAVGSPLYTSSGQSGGLFVYRSSTLEEIIFYSMPNTAGNDNRLGSSIIYDDTPYPTQSNFGLVFAGAPGSYSQDGSVLIISINNAYQATVKSTINNPVGGASNQFGSSIFVQRNTNTKKVIVGAPVNNAAYSYIVTASQVSGVTVSQPIAVNSVESLSANANWGYAIVGSDDATHIAISAPYNNLKNINFVVANSATSFAYDIGHVAALYTVSGSTVAQTIYSPFGDNGHFGLAMAMSSDASYLAIAAPNTLNPNNSRGAVAIYTITNNLYVLNQILSNVVTDSKMYFGMALDINTLSNKLIVSSLGTNTTVLTTFDTITTFDLDSTRFFESEDYSGTTYLYTRKNSRFVFSQEVNELTESISSLTNFGAAVSIDETVIFVGAPSTVNQSTGSVYKFSQIDKSTNGWQKHRTQENLVDASSVKQIKLIDTSRDSILTYYDYVDPIKGKILGIADEELAYKTASDPAIYSIGGMGVNVDTNNSWIDQQVGQLWWDLSNAKYIWYEQGELEYRKNNWGKLFPGAGIDVYEWVGTSLLPSEWSVQADTPAGLSKGVSGQPKYVDNSTISVKQIYDNITNSFSNLYYYWVKNKVTLPNINSRKISAFSVASYIANPTLAGIQHVAFISTSSLTISNFADRLREDQISLNLTIDKSNNKTPLHVQWQLVAEGSDKSTIPALIEKKLIDSLIGHDELGNPVPDTSLSDRSKFGIGIRPQQTLFSNRSAALRNAIEFVNTVLIDHQIVGNYNFSNLQTQELPPQPTTSSWIIIEDDTLIVKIDVNQTTTATVLVDSSSNNGWAVYQYDGTVWNKIQTQSFNTNLYWTYVDWESPLYNKYKEINFIVNDVYEISELVVSFGQYVKIRNRGDGNYIILTPTSNGGIGTFGNSYDVLYIQNGTIQFKDSLWDLPYGWDKNAAFNQLLFDQSPGIEIAYILKALKNDIFINDLKINWNLLFFKSIKYALSEQKFVDWAFKTSLVDVVNFIGTLTQTPIYKLQDTAYYENYINEVKPYHTQVRRFSAAFKNDENSNTTILDFDHPFVYSTTSSQFVPTPIPLSEFVYPEAYVPDTGQIITAGLGLPPKTKLITVPWRSVTSSIKFDRISTRDDIGSLTVTDNFVGTANLNSYQLSWLAQPDKSKISVTIDDIPVFQSLYTISYDSESYNGYTKKYSYLKLLLGSTPNNLAPNIKFNISITYQKSTELMSAVERIKNFYHPFEGMPNKILSQLMSGTAESRKIIGGQYEGLGFGNVNSGILADSIFNPSDSDYPTWNGSGLINALGASPNDIVIGGGNISENSKIPKSLLGKVTNYGAWDASTNTPPLQYDQGSLGDLYVVEKAGNFALGTFANRFVSGDQIIFDGSNWKILPATPSQSLEEQVPGFSADSIAINVYTKAAYQTPSIFNSSANIAKSTQTQVLSLSVMPPTIDSMIVSLNGRLLDYVYSDKYFTTSTQFSINWANETLLIPAQKTDGILGYSIIGVGDSDKTGLGIIDTEILPVLVTATNTSTRLIGMVNFNAVNSAYVTVDGTPINTTTSLTSTFYNLNTVSSRDSRVAVDVYNLTTGTHLIQSWFFNSSNPNFNKIVEQNYKAGNTPSFVNNANGFATGIGLVNHPLNDVPFSSQVVVELIPDRGNPVRLRPPYSTYYSVTNSDYNAATYLIVGSTSSFVVDTVLASNIQVYLNNVPLDFGIDQDYIITNNAVQLTSRQTTFGNAPVIGSKIVIETFYYNHVGRSVSIIDGSVKYDYDFMITPDGNTLLLTPNYSYLTSATIKITTFAIQDSLGIVLKRFVGNPNRTYKLDAPILNSKYLWVEINTTSTGLISLINGIDYQILPDQLTVLLSNAFYLTNQDTVFIESFADPGKSAKTLGYRISKDFLGKHHFTRLSNDDSTYLTKPLSVYDTEIYVADGSVLSPFDPATNSPGVVLIEGERIEFFKNIDNVLGQLRRGTWGTSPAEYSDVGTTVLDQGVNQIISSAPATPYSDITLIQNTYTGINLENSYAISTTTIYNWINPITSSTVRCDGIKLMTTVSTLPYDPYTGIATYTGRAYSVSTSSINASDQLEIYYGGRLLNKNQYFYHDASTSYDGILVSQIKGSVSNVSYLSTLTQSVGDAYICEDSNEVWVCTENQYNIASVPFYVYSGLKRSLPDFAITTASQNLILNTATVKINSGTQLTIVKRQLGSSWNDIISINSTTSLLNSTSTIATFLKSGPAVLPSNYFYGSASTIAKPGGGL
jgi:hypothetical protein